MVVCLANMWKTWHSVARRMKGPKGFQGGVAGLKVAGFFGLYSALMETTMKQCLTSQNWICFFVSDRL